MIQLWITAFSQQQLLDGAVQFVQDGSAIKPAYDVAVSAMGLSSASWPATVFFLPASSLPAADSALSTIEKAIIGAVISGTIGIFFAILQGCLKRAANKKLLQALGGEDDYDVNVLQPVAREIARQMKITGFMNYTTNTDVAQFKGAVSVLLLQLRQQGVDLNFKAMDPTVRRATISIIAGETRRGVLAQKGCCASFFKPRVTPQEIEDAARKIAAAVVERLKQHSEMTVSQLPLELPQLSSSKHRLSFSGSSPRSAQSPSPRVDDVSLEGPEVQHVASF